MPRKLEMAGEMEMPCYVRGYHVYKEVWKAAMEEVLVCHREPTNSTDRYADETLADRDPLGSGSSLTGLRYRQTDIVFHEHGVRTLRRQLTTI